jgi:beta-lactamase regulating signal transducer with metallopeptidase domain
MITLLDHIGPAIFRASWQAGALALCIAVLLRCSGERLSPRWRFMLWGIVLVRLLVVVTPVSPWSIFNLAPGNSQQIVRRDAKPDAGVNQPPDSQRAEHAVDQQTNWQREPDLEAPQVPNLDSESLARDAGAVNVSPPVAPKPAYHAASGESFASLAPLAVRTLTALWLAGCLVSGLRLLAASRILQRRLSACRAVQDGAVLKLLESARLQVGIVQTPALFVTPEAVSPCIVGARHPRIVLPESIVTDGSAARLRYVLAHELAHLLRGDLWTNWLLLAARVVHWFNPVAWWTIREMQAEREADCDDIALVGLGNVDRSAYTATIIDLAAKLTPSVLAPGMIGLFSATRHLRSRVERLVRAPAGKTLWSPIAAAFVLATALIGLTDAVPAGALAQQGSGQPAAGPKQAAKRQPAKSQAKESQATKEPEAGTATYVIRGRCVDHEDSSPLAGMQVRLFKSVGQHSPPVEVAKAWCNAEGRFEFPRVVTPGREDHHDRVKYTIIAISDDRPIGIGDGMPFQKEHDIRISREKAKISGTVVDAQGRPVAGATVMQDFMNGWPIPGILSAKTDGKGHFEIDKIGVFKLRDGSSLPAHFSVSHADYPKSAVQLSGPLADVVIPLPDGCRITGKVTDGVTKRPAAGAVVTAQRLDAPGEFLGVTDAAGRFRMAVPEARYNVLVEARDRVCIATTDHEFLVGAKVELPPFTLIAGGFISGRVVNTVTGQPVTVTEQGAPLMLGLFGPSQSQGFATAPQRLAAVDEDGRFALRAAPGDNFPYFVNFRGQRMAWDTRKQPPVVVKEGETTNYDMLITPEVPPAEKLNAAQKLVDSFSKVPSERTARIIAEFRKLESTVDECELWCTLMRELVAVGPSAVPQLCAELDRTTENKTLRRLAFALRAIGDPRAVPALIRAFPKTLLPASSDYGLIVNDRALAAFMQTHDLAPGAGGTYFDFGRPEREISGALRKLTGQNLGDDELFGISRSSDPRRQVLQRRMFVRQAQRWQTWWEAHWRDFTKDAEYQKVNLAADDEALPPASKKLGPHARTADGEGMAGAVLSPAIEDGKYAWHFYDLDTGRQPRWPAHIPRDESRLDEKELADWAAESGTDLMCITHRAADGTETYVLKTFGMKAWEISPRDLRNIDRLIAAGTLPEGKDVGELLMHYDAASEQFVPEANGAFIFVTRGGSLGLIEITGRVVTTANVAGLAAPQPGVGFHKGVRFNLKPIVP